jgi:hypothetical protein
MILEYEVKLAELSSEVAELIEYCDREKLTLILRSRLHDNLTEILNKYGLRDCHYKLEIQENHINLVPLDLNTYLIFKSLLNREMIEKIKTVLLQNNPELHKKLCDNRILNEVADFIDAFVCEEVAETIESLEELMEGETSSCKCGGKCSKHETTQETCKCPVCGGNGLVPNGFYNTVTGEIMTNSVAPEKCRSCDGTGIVITTS